MMARSHFYKIHFFFEIRGSGERLTAGNYMPQCYNLRIKFYITISPLYFQQKYELHMY